jgi:hypothetical protein
METENRLHIRARVKWPVSIKAPTGIIDGTTENFTLMLQTHVEKKTRQSAPDVVARRLR